jgi:hypothetical protein
MVRPHFSKRNFIILAIAAFLLVVAAGAFFTWAASQTARERIGRPPANLSAPLNSYPAPTEMGTKPTQATTGPRTPVTNREAGSLRQGTYENVRFTGDVEIPANAEPVTLRNCVIEGSLSIRSTNLVTIEHCAVNGWLGHRTDNTDPTKQLLIIRNSIFTGPSNNDAVRLGNSVGWGDNSTYQNVLIEDSIFHSPFSSTDSSAHFDVLQFGGGNNYTFNRVVFSFIRDSPAGVGVAYINNDTQNGNVVFNSLWVEGGPVTYVLRGPMSVNACVIESTTVRYGITGGSTEATLQGCVNERGEGL